MLTVNRFSKSVLFFFVLIRTGGGGGGEGWMEEEMTPETLLVMFRVLFVCLFFFRFFCSLFFLFRPCRLVGRAAGWGVGR